MAPIYQKIVFRKRFVCRGKALYPAYPAKASLHKGYSIKGGGPRTPPLCRLAFGGYVRDRAMSQQKRLSFERLSLKSRSHVREQSFKNGPAQDGLRRHQAKAQACGASQTCTHRKTPCHRNRQ